MPRVPVPGDIRHLRLEFCKVRCPTQLAMWWLNTQDVWDSPNFRWFMSGEAKCWDLWSGKEDFLAMLCLCPPQVCGIRENPDSELSSEDCGW